MGFWNSLLGGSSSVGCSPQEAASLMEQGVPVLDVRTPAEFRSGHITGSHNIPLGELEARSGELPREGKLLVTCRSGARSQSAIRQLETLGFEGLVNLDGGLMAWKGAGLPVAK